MMRTFVRWSLVYVLLAGLHLFQKSVYLFGPVEWLQPVVTRSYSFWQIAADLLVDSVRSVAPFLARRGTMFTAHLVIDTVVCLLLIRLHRIFGRKLLLFAPVISLPLFSMMPPPNPTAHVSLTPVVISWVAWYLFLAAATIAVLREDRTGRNFVFLVMLMLPFCTIVLPLHTAGVEVQLPIGLAVGMVLVALYATRMLRRRGGVPRIV